jgi:hypothetical protein
MVNVADIKVKCPRQGKGAKPQRLIGYEPGAILGREVSEFILKRDHASSIARQLLSIVLTKLDCA